MKTGILFLLMLSTVFQTSVAVAASAGEKLFARNCTMCHIVSGRGGAIGPDLTKVALRMTTQQLSSKISYPRKSVQGSTMPAFATLKAQQMQSLLEYLNTLR